MLHDHGHPVHLPPLYAWELTANSTRYERIVAAPSDDERVLMWSLWGAVTVVCLAIVVTVFLGLLSNAKVRQSPFNQYLLFLMIPDIVYTMLCMPSCIMNATQGYFYSDFWCYFQSWFTGFGISGSAWMNALLGREIYRMLSYGQNFRHYETPTLRRICRDSVGTLLLAAFIASWGVWGVSWLPHETVLNYGIGCFPHDHDLATSLFFYLIFFWALLGLPMGYVVFLVYQIWKHQMLPAHGRRRRLATFFVRLVSIYVFMWLPAFLMVSVFEYFSSPWTYWAGGTWAHLQGAVSAMFILTKPDARQAVKDMLLFRCKPFDDDYNKRARRSARRDSVSRFMRGSARLFPTGYPFAASEVFDTPQSTTIVAAGESQQVVDLEEDLPEINEENQLDTSDDNSERLGGGFESGSSRGLNVDHSEVPDDTIGRTPESNKHEVE